MDKILFVASECQPFFASGGLADVIGSLPQAIAQESDEYEIAVMLPLYQTLGKTWRDKLTFAGHIVVPLAWRKQFCGIYRYETGGVKYFFLDNEYYFKRTNLYGYYDDAERFAFFCRAVLEVIWKVDFVPDIIHAHDWHTALVPIYLKTLFKDNQDYAKIRTVFTIHNIEYQGKYSLDDDIMEDVFGIDNAYESIVEYRGLLNLMKGATECSDLVTTVSPTYANQIREPGYSSGLNYQIERVQSKMRGILNGIDTTFYNPQTDASLFAQFNKNNAGLKATNKAELQKMLNLPVDPSLVLIGMVGRLVRHKGLELIKEVFDQIMSERVQLVILGTGDSLYEGFLKDMELKYGSRLRSIVAFNQDLSRKIYAASDVFLMPSESEPCGLSQMIASRYGSIPIVRETGGLKDSIHDFSQGQGNGYTFADFNSGSMLNAIRRAVADFQDKEAWLKKVIGAMDVDFSWQLSAKRYLEMYGEFKQVRRNLDVNQFS